MNALHRLKECSATSAPSSTWPAAPRISRRWSNALVNRRWWRSKPVETGQTLPATRHRGASEADLSEHTLGLARARAAAPPCAARARAARRGGRQAERRRARVRSTRSHQARLRSTRSHQARLRTVRRGCRAAAPQGGRGARARWRARRRGVDGLRAGPGRRAAVLVTCAAQHRDAPRGGEGEPDLVSREGERLLLAPARARVTKTARPPAQVRDPQSTPTQKNEKEKETRGFRARGGLGLVCAVDEGPCAACRRQLACASRGVSD